MYTPYTRNALAILLAATTWSLGVPRILPAIEAPAVRFSGQVPIDEMVGWYLVDGASYRMLTWGADGDLLLNDFSTPEQMQILGVSTGEPLLIEQDGTPYELALEHDDDGVREFSWLDHRGRRHVATRAEQYGYRQREIRYTNGSTELAGLLLLPIQSGLRPGVVMIHGAGHADRDDIWYLYQADFLARRGIAVLLPDKRGCGKSGGSWETASFEDFAGDALAGVDMLQQTIGVDANRVGVMGLSEGGWIAPLATARSPEVGFVVNVSGSAVSPDEQIRHEISSDLRGYGTPDFLVPLLAFALERRKKHRRDAWWDQNGDFDVRPHWEAIDRPALVVYGDMDGRNHVPVRESVAILEAAKAASDNREFTVHVFTGTDHTMQDPRSGWIRRDYLDFLASWILARLA